MEVRVRARRNELDWAGLERPGFDNLLGTYFPLGRFNSRLNLDVESLAFRGQLRGGVSGLAHFMLTAQRILFKGVYWRMIFCQAGTVGSDEMEDSEKNNCCDEKCQQQYLPRKKVA